MNFYAIMSPLLGLDTIVDNAKRYPSTVNSMSSNNIPIDSLMPPLQKYCYRSDRRRRRRHSNRQRQQQELQQTLITQENKQDPNVPIVVSPSSHTDKINRTENTLQIPQKFFHGSKDSIPSKQSKYDSAPKAPTRPISFDDITKITTTINTTTDSQHNYQMSSTSIIVVPSSHHQQQKYDRNFKNNMSNSLPPTRSTTIARVA